jgi:hypothetical protein
LLDGTMSPLNHVQRAARRRSYIVLGAILFFILALVTLGIQCARSRGQDAKADRHVATSKDVDRAHEAQAAASARVDTVVDTLWRVESSHKAKAAAIAHVADTAGQSALSIRDTASMWHLRWQLRGVVIAEKDSALVAADLRADSLRLDRIRWHALADRAVASQDSLRDDLHVARTGCRIVPLVPCMSRKQTLIVGGVTGVVLGVVGTVLIERRK